MSEAFEMWWRAGLCVDDEAQRRNNEREEGYARDGWNAALDAVLMNLPTARIPMNGAGSFQIGTAKSWNKCRDESIKALDSLKVTS